MCYTASVILRTYYAPGTVLGVEDAIVSKRQLFIVLGIYILAENWFPLVSISLFLVMDIFGLYIIFFNDFQKS